MRSLGPANPSIPTTPATCRLASWTHRLPGPTITSTCGIDLGPVGQRGDRLGAGDAEDGVDPAQLGRGEDHRMRRGGDVDLLDARGARGDRAHHDRGRIRVPAAGRVDRGAADRDLAQLDRLALGERRPCGRRRAPPRRRRARWRSRPRGPRARPDRARRARSPARRRRPSAAGRARSRASRRRRSAPRAPPAPCRRPSRTAAMISRDVGRHRRAGRHQRAHLRGDAGRVLSPHAGAPRTASISAALIR